VSIEPTSVNSGANGQWRVAIAEGKTARCEEGPLGTDPGLVSETRNSNMQR
jgi:hypothetical protein